VIRIPGFRRRAKIADNVPPAPQRANQARGLPAIEHILVIHTSNPGGARGILTEPKIAPWGEATAIKEGGEYRCCELTRESGTVHHQKAKMWVTNTNSHILTGLAFLSQPSLQHKLSGIRLWFLVSSESDLGARKRVDVLWRWPVTAHL